MSNLCYWGGFAACEEALFLTQYASKVTMIVREEDFTCAKTIADQVRAHDQIETIFETEIVEVGGHDTMEYAVFRIIVISHYGVMMLQHKDVLESLFLLDMFHKMNYFKISWH